MFLWDRAALEAQRLSEDAAARLGTAGQPAITSVKGGRSQFVPWRDSFIRRFPCGGGSRTGAGASPERPHSPCEENVMKASAALSGSQGGSEENPPLPAPSRVWLPVRRLCQPEPSAAPAPAPGPGLRCHSTQEGSGLREASCGRHLGKPRRVHRHGASRKPDGAPGSARPIAPSSLALEPLQATDTIAW